MRKKILLATIAFLFGTLIAWAGGTPSLPLNYQARIINGKFYVVRMLASPDPAPQGTFINSRGLRVDGAGTLYAISPAMAASPTIINSILGVAVDANGYLIVSVSGGGSGTGFPVTTTVQVTSPGEINFATGSTLNLASGSTFSCAGTGCPAKTDLSNLASPTAMPAGQKLQSADVDNPYLQYGAGSVQSNTRAYFSPTAIATPSAPVSVTPSPSGGSTTWGYSIVAAFGNLLTPIGPELQDTGGPATLDSGDTESIVVPSVVGATGCYVLRTTAGGSPSDRGMLNTTANAQGFHVAAPVTCGSTYVDDGSSSDSAISNQIYIALSNSTQGFGVVGSFVNTIPGIDPSDQTNTFFGYGALASLTADQNIGFAGNTAFGYQAGYSNTTGNSNQFEGFYAGFSNTTGNSNQFEGFYAGYSNTTGSNNQFSGFQAGSSNTTGNSNQFEGFYAGYSNTTGSQNQFSGYQAGYSNTTGNSNQFEGFYAGFSNTTGSDNQFEGRQAGYSNTTGSNNQFSGFLAGSSNTTGSRNQFAGYQAGSFNTTGTDNSIFGSFYFNNNFPVQGTGSMNTLLGNQSDVATDPLMNATAVGFATQAQGSNQVFLGNAAYIGEAIYGNPNSFNNAIVTSGTYSGTSNVYCIEIDSIGTPDTFEWGTDPTCQTFTATGVAITGAAQDLSDGVQVTIASTTGHVLGDVWFIPAAAAVTDVWAGQAGTAQIHAAGVTAGGSNDLGNTESKFTLESDDQADNLLQLGDGISNLNWIGTNYLTLDDGAGNQTIGYNTAQAGVANSPYSRWCGTFEATSGPTYGLDCWNVSNVIGAGVNGTSALTFAHSGSSGALSLPFPAGTTTNISTTGNAATATAPASPPWGYANGGTNATTQATARNNLFPCSTEGSIAYWTSSAAACLGVGAVNTVPISNGTDPVYGAVTQAQCPTCVVSPASVVGGIVGTVLNNMFSAGANIAWFTTGAASRINSFGFSQDLWFSGLTVYTGGGSGNGTGDLGLFNGAPFPTVLSLINPAQYTSYQTAFTNPIYVPAGYQSGATLADTGSVTVEGITANVVNMATQPMGVGFGGGSVAGSTTVYSGPSQSAALTNTATESLDYVIAPYTFTASNLCIYNEGAQPSGGALTVTLRDTPSPYTTPTSTALTTNVPTSGVSGLWCDTTHTVTINATDAFDFQIANASSSTSATLYGISMLTTLPAGATGMIIFGTGSRTMANASTLYFSGFSSSVGNTTEQVETAPAPRAFTASNLSCYVTTAPLTNSNAITVRKNLSSPASGLTVTLALLTTGLIQDTTHTISFANKDSLDLADTQAAGTAPAVSSCSMAVN